MKTEKSLKITILGKSFFIVTDEDTEDVLQAASLVDFLMQEKLEKSPSGNESKLALITALQIATDLKKSLREFDEYKKITESLVSFINQESSSQL